MSFHKKFERRSDLMKINEQAIRDHNAKLLPRLLRITGALMCIPLLMCIFRAEMRDCLPGYLSLLLLCVVLAGVFYPQRMKKHSLLGIYIMFTGVFGLVLYLSVIAFPGRYVASALSFFCVMPLLFIDKQWRLDSILFIYYIIHTVLSFKLKGPGIAAVDAVNCFISVFLGIVAGDAVLGTQLSAINSHRQLVIEKETDVLTGLNNRRKLFETMTLLEAGKDKKPTGVLMLDVDHFKEVNDLHGHAAGDACLKDFGALLQNFQQIYDIRFYRYGGEEFVGLSHSGSEQELLTLADSIRLAVSRKSLGGLDITVSIGEAWCGDAEYNNLELWIDKADKAAYEAKANGRNSLFRYISRGDTAEVYKNPGLTN